MSAQHERLDFHGLSASRITVDGANLTVTDYGAHICSWTTPDGVERLFLSDTAVFDARSPIRGGVPVIFPQFGTNGPLTRHGFARTATWQAPTIALKDDFATLTWRLTHSDSTLALWPHQFAVELTALLSASRLDIELDVKCLDQVPFDFHAALHTYLAVHEVEHVRLIGLEGCEYIDHADRGKRKSENNEAVMIEAETDRIYLSCPESLLLREPRRTLEIQSLGFPHTVVWNPWDSGSRAIKDMSKGAFRRMLCVEAAAANARIRLAPGESWIGRQSLIAQ